MNIDHRDAVEHIVRHDAARIVAALIRKCGSFDQAEDALQDALTAAVTTWPATGVPSNPPAWVIAVAQRRLIDGARRARTRDDAAGALAYELSRSTGGKTMRKGRSAHLRSTPTIASA